MSIPRYRTGERVRVIVEGPIVDVLASGVELTVALETPNASYEVTVPTSHVTIERLAPAGGEPQPSEVWRTATGVELWAYRSTVLGEVVLRDGDGVMFSWQGLHTDPRLGPITRVYPLPVPVDAPQPWPEADEPREPRLMLGDVWSDDSDDEWTVLGQDGRLLLTWDGETRTWESADSQYGPLTLIERAGYRRTTDTATAGQLRSGQVVSCPDWCDGAPVRLLTVQALNADGETEVTYEPLGDDAVGTGTAAPDVRTTLWFGRAVDRG